MVLQVSKPHPTLIEPGTGDALNTSALLLSQSFLLEFETMLGVFIHGGDAFKTMTLAA